MRPDLQNVSMKQKTSNGKARKAKDLGRNINNDAYSDELEVSQCKNPPTISVIIF